MAALVIVTVPLAVVSLGLEIVTLLPEMETDIAFISPDFEEDNDPPWWVVTVMVTLFEGALSHPVELVDERVHQPLALAMVVLPNEVEPMPPL